MENKQLTDLARDQLNRVLGFFPRVDAKISVLLSCHCHAGVARQ